jgi:hypothetical protein
MARFRASWVAAWLTKIGWRSMQADQHAETHGSGPFSPADVEAFRADDRGAATAIVCLMFGIFTIGLCGYALVCLWVAS